MSDIVQDRSNRADGCVSMSHNDINSSAKLVAFRALEVELDHGRAVGQALFLPFFKL